jgi:predicted amidohydrolase
MWRYDKNYPWGWERGYFRDGQGVTIARTELGDFGLMICWDTAHLDLWRQYAGQVDMMVISSCPPDVTNPTYHLPDGTYLTLDDFGPLAVQAKDTGRLLFGDMVNQQTAWLGVPAAQTVGTGHIQTDIPNGLLSLALFLPAAPWLAKYLPQANRLQLSCDFVQGCKVVGAQGQVLAELAQAQGERFTLAEVTLADNKPTPRSPQPKSLLPKSSYFVSDILIPWLTIPVYRRGLRRAWGANMAPIQTSTRRRLWGASLGVIALLGLGLVASIYLSHSYRRGR